MSDTFVHTLLVTVVVEYDASGAEVVLHVGGTRVPTGIKAPTTVAAVKLLVDRLAGTAP
jgi:hypothetical protein